MKDELQAKFEEEKKNMVEEVEKQVKTALEPRIKVLETKLAGTVPQKKLNECVERALEQKGVVYTDQLDEKIAEVVKQHPHTSSADQAMGMTPGSPTSPGSQMTRCVNKVSSEVVERAKRETNIIILGMAEPETTLNQKSEVVTKDRETLQKLFNTVLRANIREENVKEATRIGKKDSKTRTNPQGNQSKYLPRPIKISLSSANEKDRIFQHLSNLKDSEFDHISIRHDLTQLQRKEQDKMRLKARDMQTADQSGNFLYRVRGPPGNLRVAKINTKTRLEEDM